MPEVNSVALCPNCGANPNENDFTMLVTYTARVDGYNENHGYVVQGDIIDQAGLSMEDDQFFCESCDSVFSDWLTIERPEDIDRIDDDTLENLSDETLQKIADVASRK